MIGCWSFIPIAPIPGPYGVPPQQPRLNHRAASREKGRSDLPTIAEAGVPGFDMST